MPRCAWLLLQVFVAAPHPRPLLRSPWLLTLTSTPTPCPPADIVFCGTKCIDKTTQCCQMDYSVGLTCPGTQVCVSDGSACAASCPSEKSGSGRRRGRKRAAKRHGEEGAETAAHAAGRHSATAGTAGWNQPEGNASVPVQWHGSAGSAACIGGHLPTPVLCCCVVATAACWRQRLMPWQLAGWPALLPAHLRAG